MRIYGGCCQTSGPYLFVHMLGQPSHNEENLHFMIQEAILV